MPPGLKITKDISTHLFKYVKNIDITFNPFDSRTRSARELLRQVQAQRFVKANPKLKIAANVVSTPNPPQVRFQFADDSEHLFDSQNFLANEMLDEVYLITNEMDIDYEIEGKSIDDM
mmetsp:Transcript_1801/g.2593  ORF Transcript_1801/g.2593 Transcript_1801/m.2593 type:complete len:118 (+) Transcript_1801:80-433(+)|eukprot:CAMPEP_0184855446 /NCGR_PEP_ID=MMETSP0580-20130426/697_1 /TAXON_ID=1118495 /ORGANISM="Dactyliosolen fragilissimus" /LENGTH=117 /DNA_ID=CAMNT_0027349959 /DNA_START=13 /DNA_END=366 /DNA_ORIENTATION=+